MITPAYAPTATERVLPRLALDFTTAIADPRVTTSRAANTATRFNASGLIEIVNANLPRFDFSPTALVCLGQLIEEARTNLFLNSLIDGTNLATQSVTLSAITYTLSFYGSGSVAISGGHSATVNGVGDFPNRKTYTFTPTAGSSTFTISGDVKFAQVEAGAFATSYIPTTTTSLTRNADVVTMTGTNFSSWYNQSEGTLCANAIFASLTQSGQSGMVSISDGTNGRVNIYRNGAGPWAVASVSESGGQSASYFPTISAQPVKTALAYKSGSVNFALNGTAGTTNTGMTNMPTGMDRLYIGSLNTGTAFLANGHLQSVRFFPIRLTNAELRAVTS